MKQARQFVVHFGGVWRIQLKHGRDSFGIASRASPVFFRGLRGKSIRGQH